LRSTLARYFLLLAATPHNGKEAGFQLFIALPDGDRFEGRFRDGVHVTDASDITAKNTMNGHFSERIRSNRSGISRPLAVSPLLSPSA
jgi:hypothetical protein